MPNVPKTSSQYLCNKTSSRKMWRMKLIFCQSFLQGDFNTLGIKVSYKVILSLLQGMINHSQRTWSNKFTISVRYLKNEVTNGGHILHADIHLQVRIIVFDGSDQTVQSTKNSKLVIFLQYNKKRVSQLLSCCIELQKIQIFYGGPVMFVTCFLA